MLQLVSLLAMLLLLTGCAAAQPEATIRVHPDRALGPVNHRVLGNNQVGYDPAALFGTASVDEYSRYGAGMWDPVARRPVPEAVRLTKEMGMPVARFPGGCGVHSYDWKQTIGPPAQRPHWAFGLDEFLRVCAATDSEPLLTVSDYTGTPQDAADLVEYLNAPADAANPWAQRRAANGHPGPYHVRWFELGNETDHGNHEMKPPRRMSPREYAAWVIDCSLKMKAIDPTIQIGALVATTGKPDEPWNHTVLPLVKDAVDFIIVHTYAVGVWGEGPLPASDRLMCAALAAPGQLAQTLAEYRALIRRHCGRDLPLAITEYNASFVQEKPLPYRLTLGAALFCGDYLRVLLQPDTNVLMANYWQFINEYWGELKGPVKGEDQPYVKRPAYYVHWLYGNHFGDTLVAAEAESPTFDCEGYGSTLPAKGTVLRPAPQVLPGDLLAGATLASSEGDGWRVAAEDHALAFTLGAFQGNTYPLLARLPVVPGRGYRLTGEAKTEGGPAGTKLGVQVGDDRGWPATHSAAAQDGLEACRDWTPFSVEYLPLADSRGIHLLLRCEDKPPSARATLRLRSLRVEAVLPAAFPAVPMLTVNASTSADGRTLYLMVVNKSADRDLLTELDLGGSRARSARLWTLTGPALHATNEEDPMTCTVTERPVASMTAPLRLTFPARSMTAVEVRR
jgi:alpha-N-arabinofuranosidase